MMVFPNLYSELFYHIRLLRYAHNYELIYYNISTEYSVIMNKLYVYVQ